MSAFEDVLAWCAEQKQAQDAKDRARDEQDAHVENDQRGGGS